MIYIIKCFNDKETFYKIGITTENLYKKYSKEPYKTLWGAPYNTKLVRLHSNAPGLKERLLSLCEPFKEDCTLDPTPAIQLLDRINVKRLDCPSSIAMAKEIPMFNRELREYEIRTSFYQFPQDV